MTAVAVDLDKLVLEPVRNGYFTIVKADGTQLTKLDGSPLQFTTLEKAAFAGAVARIKAQDDQDYYVSPPAGWRINVSGFGVNPVQAPDSTPDQVVFVEQTGLPRNTVVESNIVTPVNYNQPTEVLVLFGEYRIDGGEWTSDPGTISPGSTIQLRGTTSSSYSTNTQVALYLDGAESGTFNLTTEIEIVAPGPGMRPEYVAMQNNGINVYVVDGVNGNNANPGTESQPWKEVEYAIAYAAGPCIILVRAGDYLITRRYEDHVGVSDHYSRPILSPVSQGLSETELFLIATYPGDGPVRLIMGDYVDDVGKKDSSGLVGSSNREWVWWDGFICDMDNRNGRLGTFEDTARYCRFRHMTFQNATLAGGGSNYALVYSGRGESKYLNVMEHCLLRDCRTSTNNINDGMVLLYDQSGFIARYNLIDSNYTNLNTWREKEMAKTNKVPGQLPNHYYRNIFRGGTANPGFSSGRMPLSPGSGDADEYAQYLIEENIFDDVGFGGSVDESSKSRGMENWVIRNNLFKNRPLYRCDGNNNGGLELTSGFEIYNNISVNEDGSPCYQMRPGDNDAGGAFYTRAWNKSGQPNFNAFVTPNFNVDSRYNIESIDLTRWRSYGYDLNSQVLASLAAAKFVDYANGDYNLAPDSPLKGAGRVGGELSGAAMDLGPLANGDWTALVGPTPM